MKDYYYKMKTMSERLTPPTKPGLIQKPMHHVYRSLAIEETAELSRLARAPVGEALYRHYSSNVCDPTRPHSLPLSTVSLWRNIITWAAANLPNITRRTRMGELLGKDEYCARALVRGLTVSNAIALGEPAVVWLARQPNNIISVYLKIDGLHTFYNFRDSELVYFQFHPLQELSMRMSDWDTLDLWCYMKHSLSQLPTGNRMDTVNYRLDEVINSGGTPTRIKLELLQLVHEFRRVNLTPSRDTYADIVSKYSGNQKGDDDTLLTAATPTQAMPTLDDFDQSGDYVEADDPEEDDDT